MERLTLNQPKAPAVGRAVNKYYADVNHEAGIDLWIHSGHIPVPP